MYALAFLTHWLIDTCTTYGTQIFEPFSNQRVAFNNIAIADPLYTLPMLIGLVGVILAKHYKIEKRWNYLGLALSTLYMGLTVVLKTQFNTLVESNLKAQNIAYEEYMTKPTILNCILWQTTVKSKDAYYYSTHSFLDDDPNMVFLKLPRNHELLAPYGNHEFIEILKWFAKGYYNITPREDGSLIFNNLLFGVLGQPSNKTVPESASRRYVFSYKIEELNGELLVKQNRDFDSLKVEDIAHDLWEGIKGN